MSTSKQLPDEIVELIARRFRVIGEPMRIKLLNALRERELTVTELTAAVGGSQQNVSKHLGVLYDERIVGRRKLANHVQYRIDDESVFNMCDEVCGGIQRRYAELSQIAGEVLQ